LLKRRGIEKHGYIQRAIADPSVMRFTHIGQIMNKESYERYRPSGFCDDFVIIF
jgi:hypothetical protein